MKKEIFLFLFLTIFLTNLASAICIIPTNNMNIISDTTFCTGTYLFPQGVSVISSDTTLDCNSSIMRSPGGGFAISFPANLNNLTIKNCHLDNYNIGISTILLENSTILNNTITNSTGFGILLHRANNNLLAQNKLTENEIGIITIDSNFNTIRNNEIINSVGIGALANGITCIQSDFNNITENSFTNNMNDNLLLLDLGSECNDNNVWFNDFFGTNALDPGLNNNFCVNEIGNSYFDGATGPSCALDDDGDGIGNAADLCPDSRPGELIDINGCDIFQFCNGNSCGISCFALDWRSNEPGTRFPNDCTSAVPLSGGNPLQPICVPTEFTPVCAG